MQLDLHLTNADRVNKDDLARHIVNEHGLIYPDLKGLRKWSKQELVNWHNDVHAED